MQKDAEAHAEEDKKRREVVDLKNQADQVVYQMEKTLKEHGDKVPAKIRGNIESALNNLKEAAKGDDGDAIKRAMDKLNEVSQELGKIMYEEAAKKQGAAGGAPHSPVPKRRRVNPPKAKSTGKAAMMLSMPNSRKKITKRRLFQYC